MRPGAWRLPALAGLTLAAALGAEALPLGDWQPRWLFLALAYWALTRPGETGFGLAWGFGLLQDYATGAWLGTHVIAYGLTVYLCARFHRITQHSDRVQQTFLTALLLVLHLAYLLLALRLLQGAWPGFEHWISLPASLFVCPLLYAGLDRLQRGARLARQ